MSIKIESPISMLLNAGRDSTGVRLRLIILCFAAIGAIACLLPYMSLPVNSAPRKEIKSGKQQPSPMAEERAGSSFMIAPPPSAPDSFLPVPSASRDGLWQKIDEGYAVRNRMEDLIARKPYCRLSLNRAAQAELLRLVPMEFTKAAKDIQAVITLPMPDGTFARFRVEESPIMERALAARYPQIKTYKGKGIDDPTATARFDSTPAGFHAIVLSSHGTAIIAPAAKGNPNVYLSYDKSSMQEENDSFVCGVSEDGRASTATTDKQLRLTNTTNANESIGGTLRTYRLAVAATAEYTQTYGGGTVDGALAAVTTTINLVNAIYERELNIRLLLVANETNVIFTNSATDGFTSDDPDTMFNQNQGVMDSRIGANNYDIGHVLDGHVFNFTPGRYFFQGRGSIASVCVNGQKGKGVSVFRSLEPSAVSTVYVVAHEMGHQFGASHTFNGTTTPDCLNSRVAASAYEPGTGSTIMAYRGTSGSNAGYIPICGEEDLHSTDLYFHVVSIVQIVNYTTNGNGANCAGLLDTGNNPPSVEAGPDYNIPRNTPFTLTATGSDPEGDALTYCWEETDLGLPSPPSTDDGSRPIFRSFAPASGPSRTFPQLSDILSGTATLGESLPVTTRTMNFRVTVRDNHSGGGGLSTDAMFVNVASGSGPFSVTQPVSATTWPSGSTQTVNWDVANTSNAPVGCASVRILLSVDGGLSFPIILASSVSNNGAATIVVPPAQTSMARVKVEAVGNIFFDISDANFTITAGASPTPTPTPTPNPGGPILFNLSSATYTVNEADPAGVATITVNRAGDTASAVSVDYSTSDTSALTPCQTNGNGIASDRCDYATAVGTLRFAIGETSKTILIPIINDSYVEPNETFTITLRNALGSTLGTITTASVSIQSDDAQTATQNPINSQDFFIKEQYVDFLGRAAEQGGFDFWMNRMTNCPVGDICDRIDTAKRFFESDEFQERGFYVYKLYDAGIGRFPKYAEFVPEVARLNGPQTIAEQRLGKDAYLLDFMQKVEFKNLYDQFLTADHLHAKDAASATAFVNALCTTAGITPASKATLIANLQNGSRDPAHTLEDFILSAEIGGVGTLYYDRARIVMQYFGFLRRDPERGTNPLVGFDFWWDQLTNPANGHVHDYRFMVNGFLRSDEYNFRFALISAP